MVKNTMARNFQVTVIFFAVFILIFFRYLSSSHVLMTTDAAISDANVSARTVLETSVANWHDGTLLGMPLEASTRLPRLLKAILPGVLWNNWVYGIALLLSSAVLYAFLFRKGFSFFAAVLAGLAGFWLGSNLTLIYAGHTLKPYVILFYVCALLATRIPSWGGGILWGASIGFAFMQQPDVAMFFALFAGAYLVFRIWRWQGFKPLKWLKVLLPAAAVAFLFAAGPLLSGYRHYVKGASQMQTQSKQAKWDYVTQWSFPPEEMIAFVAPGYTGWRSGEPEGPYWGRMGRSPGWERSRQGFQNFKLENTYLGLIPVAFALFALFSCRRSKHRPEILFWGGAMVVALLLAFGKFTPLYALFYKLPVVNNIRNPNKFLQVFQVCLAILAAYGLDSLFSGKLGIGVPESSENARYLVLETRRFFWLIVGVLTLFVLWTFSLTLNRYADVAQFATQGWPQKAAQTIVQNKIVSLWHASFMALALVAVFAVFSFKKTAQLLRFKNWIAAALVLIVAVDAVALSKHYVKEMPRSYIEANALTKFLKDNLGHQRVALLSQQGIYGIWTTYLLPYNRIPAFNFAQMPRMSTDYKAFLEAGNKNPLNMWRFSAVKYLLGPASLENQLAGQAQKVFAYDLAQGDEAGGFKVVASMMGQQAVFELLNTSPRYAVVAPVEPLPVEQGLRSVVQSPRPQTGTADALSYRPGNLKLKVDAENPATLRVAEKWDPDWKAEIDGKPVELKRIDFICQGVDIPAGEHEVILRYAPSKLFFYMQCAGYMIVLGSLLLVARSPYAKT